MKVSQLIKRFFLPAVYLISLVGCQQVSGVIENQFLPSTTAKVDMLQEPYSTPRGNPTVLTTRDATVTPTPSLPIIGTPVGCDSANAPGHILFLTTSGISGQELHIMDGNGCNHHLMMRGVSGSPDWTGDGTRIWIGCENDQYICILDAPATLNTCLKEGEECQPKILEKYPLPDQEGQKTIYNTSLSADGKKLLAEIHIVSIGTNVYLLNLDGDGQWRLIIKNTRSSVDLSPISDEIIMDGIWKMPLNGGPLEGYHPGTAPEWSADGKKIAFLYKHIQSRNESKEYSGIMEWDFEREIHWRVLYEPAPYDPMNWARRNVIFSGTFSRLLSWSPDGNYIAFVGDYAYTDDSQIFRLDTRTGEVVILSRKIEKTLDYKHYEAPAWGP